MDIKELLQDLCLNLEKQINFVQIGNYKKVEFFSGLRPNSYSLNGEIYVVEIRVDDKVIFLESYIPIKGEDLKLVENTMLTELLRSVFNYGILASKQSIEHLI